MRWFRRTSGAAESGGAARAPVELEPPDAAALGLDWNFNDRSDRLYRTGHRLSARGYFEEAAELFERAVRYDRSHYNAYVAWSETLVILGRLPEAADVAEDALARYGRNAALGAARGHVFLHRNDFDRALEFSDIATRNDPENAYGWLVAGETRLAAAGGFQYAMECFARSRAAEEFWPLLNVRIARAELEWGQVDQARASLQAIVRAEPGIAQAWMLLGDCRRESGHLREASACYERAVRLSPELTALRETLGWRARAGVAFREFGRAVRRAMAPP